MAPERRGGGGGGEDWGIAPWGRALEGGCNQITPNTKPVLAPSRPHPWHRLAPKGLQMANVIWLKLTLELETLDKQVEYHIVVDAKAYTQQG